MDKLEEDLTCSVCYSLFSDPRVLPCSHTFCKTCLDNVLHASGDYSVWRPLRLKCPHCRSVVELPPSGSLPVNVSLQAIIEKYQKHSHPRPPSCPEHLTEPLNMYCVQDRQMICGLCLTVGQHQGHHIDDLQAAVIREKETLALLLERLSDQRWAQMCELGEQLQQEKSRCETLVRKDRLAVEQFFWRLEQILVQKKEASLGALDNASADISQTYDPLIQRVKELQEEHLNLVSLASSIEEDSPLDFLENMHLFRNEVEEFLKAPLPSGVALSINSRAAEYLQQNWPAITIGSLEEAPIPKVSCCAKCGAQEASLEARTGSDQSEGMQDLWSRLQPSAAILLLGLLLLGAELWVNPVGTASLGFSLLSQLSQLVHGLSSELATSVCEMAGSLYTVMGEAVERWSSSLFTLGENALQFVTAFF